MRKQLRHITIQSGRNVMFLLLLLQTALQTGAQTIGGNVYGGGEKGEVAGNSDVTIKSGKLGTFAARGVTTGGNVYGGGNAGNLLGHTTVTLQGGNICGGVFGGAQQADVKKYTYVNIDGANQVHDLTVGRVFGGNDVSGVIGADQGGTEGAVTGLPFTPEVNTPSVTVDNTWQSFIQATPEKSDEMDIFIGQMFGGGNGDYDYTTGDADSNPYYGKTAPTVAKTYLQINGGTYGYVFAGGNAATVTAKTVISVNNTSTITTATDSLDLTAMSPITSIDPDNKVDWRLLSMGLNLSTFQTGHHFNRIFGGNNKADMAIMPTWNLQAGDVINLYSGGNEGRMIHKKGILLEIKSGSELIAENVYGGCRKADVRPLTDSGADMDDSKIQLDDANYHFPPGFSARTLVRGGTIQNVYGGNDISGKVYGGNAVGVYTSILGDVYGGGNGSYAYTDNADLKDDLIWGDFYYDPSTATSSVEALNAHRPNAEQVSLRLKGTDETHRTIIGGSVYVGGNSATLATTKVSPTVELKIGSHVIADNVFLGNNGANMIDNTILGRYAGTVTKADQTPNQDFSSLTLTDTETFASYMDGCAMTIKPSVKFDGDDTTDSDTYEDYSTYFGSFFGGGNVGSMIMPGKVTLNFDKQVVIFNKLVGGCNSANIAAQDGLNAAYNGGVIGSAAEQASYTDNSGNIKDRIVLNLSQAKLVPLRWKVKVADSQPSAGTDLTNLNLATMDAQGIVTLATGTAQSDVTYYEYLDANGDVCTNANGKQPTLEYNVFNHSTGQPILGLNAAGLSTGTSSSDDLTRRLLGANVYGACYNSGHVNGNVVINLNNTIHDRDHLFDEITATEHLDGNESYNITTRHTGVILNEQAMDVSTLSLAVLGAGYGTNSEVWGSATVNLNKGFTFQIYAGGQQGIVGKASNLAYDAKYSTFSNLNGTIAGVADGASGDSDDMAESVFIYGGSYEGTILGNTQVNLGNGRVYNSIAGSCTANIYGHSEMYIGRNSSDDSNQGFPWVIDDVYGGNDVAGEIKGSATFTSRVREAARSLVYDTDALTANAYVEYQQGYVRSIFGGSCGDFDYTNDTDYSGFANFVSDKSVPLFIENAFVNFSPLVDNNNNHVGMVFGASQGHKDGAYKDKMQNRSYVLVDAPQGYTTFTSTEFFGAGSYGGVGMNVAKTTADANESGVEASAVVDLVRGQVSAAYGGSYNQGVTRRTIVNVPSGSTTVIKNIFGGAYGTDDGTSSNVSPCDVYQSIVNFGSDKARVNGALYGGNNNYRRTLYTQVNVNAPVKQSNGYDGYAYGAGKGANTWAQYTEVNLNSGSSVYEVYGGGDAGKVLNQESLTAWNTTRSGNSQTAIDYSLASNEYTENYLANDLAKTSNLYTDLDKDAGGLYKDYAEKYNTNVIVNQDATVKNYAYGGGYGDDATVSGSTYIELNGGTVDKDIYAAGTSGAVMDLYRAKNFTASANAYIRGGRVRNVYGGGWKGDVGYHNSETTATTDDVLGETHVVIGKTACGEDSRNFYCGLPTVRRNAYGGGEGGCIYGTTNLDLYGGYVGYKYNTETSKYEEHLDDRTADDGIGRNLLVEAGNLFGSGYADYSNADFTNVTLYGGTVRNSIYGGGEIGTVGRGLADGTVHLSGSTHVEMFDGAVKHDAFGGGRGFDNRSQVSAIGTSGYVFGSTEIHIHGGEVGTEAGVGNGYGNVFGGGNIGFVYSGKGTKRADGYYYDTSSKLTEDCKVVVKPYCKVKTEYDTYAQCQYVPTEELDTYAFNNENWANLDKTGITIHNAVFAGGNVSTGSDQVYANTETVFGNATASVIDLFDMDLISVGDDGIGGIYGDGNLTLVDGYRELNITNYGTDYNHLKRNLTYEEYKQLNKRQRAYYELKYQAKETHTYEFYKSLTTHSYNNVIYKKGQKVPESTWNGFSPDERNNWSTSKQSISYAEKELITETEHDLMDDTERSKWDLYGFCTLFEGRMINTIQRADFCGVFGSRIVLRGAQDRVPSVVDYTDYTINRVKELSLNHKTNTSIKETPNGNYFGIYNVVNYLGALTSDVGFNDSVRVSTDQVKCPDDDQTTYYEYKKNKMASRYRNNGTCQNEVALSSGVALWILDESTETAGEKVYGPITGVVQLDLINVARGEGGGYVYAKNQHGTPNPRSDAGQVTLTAANNGAISQKQYTYQQVGDGDRMETSGNFINPSKRIVDDCYPTSNSFYGEGAAPGHYWFVRGEFYVYDQYISAYTGSTQAYPEVVTIPLTITAESQGKLQLESVHKNLYAYWDSATLLPKYQSTTDENAIVVAGVTYHKNDPISYWTWSHLAEAEKDLFWDGETYVCTNTATYNNVKYTAGDVFTSKPADIYVCTQQYTYTDAQSQEQTVEEGNVITASNYEHLDDVAKTHYALVFNPSNVLDNDNGFLLTFDWDNPNVWNDYYHEKNGAGKITAKGNALDDNHITSPSYHCTSGGVFGQVNYSKGDIIGKTVHDYEAGVTSHLTEDERAKQGYFAAAYVAKADCQFTDGTTNYQYVKGACISATDFNSLSADANKAYFDEGMLCEETYAKSETEYYLFGEVIPKADYDALYNEASADEKTKIATCFSNAYICTTAGLWGGEVFAEGTNYPAIKYSNLNASERENFTYNYDALNLLIDKNYQNKLQLYDSSDENGEKTLYAKQQSIDYTATYTGSNKQITKAINVTRNGNNISTQELQTGDVLTNTVYENDLINYQYNYTPIVVSGTDTNNNYYIVHEKFQVGDKAYMPGNKISETEYNGLGSYKSKVTQVSKETLNTTETLPTGNDTKSYYFCTRKYTPSGGSEVAVGNIISKESYDALTNEQVNFTIDGTIPTETSTLYVAREANIDQLSSDRIITVAYWYDYVESDETGSSYETIREKHIVNIHVHFESGVPTIGELLPPRTVLPGDMLSLNKPTVTKGAYEILGGGWEIFPNENDAVSHQNGSAYTNYTTPMYWYQDGYWVAYYAKSYLGKTYSNPVQISVANYHDIDEVMQDKEHHMYVDNPNVKRDSKIYIDNRTCESDENKNELDLLKDLYDLSISTEVAGSGELKDHQLLDSHVSQLANLDFILQSDMSPKKYTDWNSIGSEGKCFEGTLHGDGYTISGLNNSLFNYLCGNVYNLGVKGTFTGAGVAEAGLGYVENCWISTTGEPGGDRRAVFGNPSATEGVKQIVNCYYPSTKNYSTTDTNNHGLATAKSEKAFYNGEVSYDLNGFYLYKRYCDNTNVSSGVEYKNYTGNADNTLTLSGPKYYADNMSSALCSSGYNGLKYVEDRFADGDFIYAGGTIPDGLNERYYEGNYYPIWPDDYIFFGQMLNYGHNTDNDHQPLPSHINKSGTRLQSSGSNRVYRAPAYFQSSQMNVAHFNPNAYFAEKSKDGTRTAYPDMTAIDFTGHNDVKNGYLLGTPTTGFYPPLLDDDGLTGFTNVDETKNLLVYISLPTATATDAVTMTNNVVSEYLPDDAYAENDANYRTVSASTATINGHRVVKDTEGYTEGTYTADVDHRLVDKQDFNAPIAYTFASGKRMWYQRTPDTYVDMTKGWEGISIPFSAELVTTQQKGEITHFYAGSATETGSSAKIGHEYWLREFKAGGKTSDKIYTAVFNYPANGTEGRKTCNNTFLWDYYYSESSRQDENTDTYQQYYQSSRTYENYGYSTAAKPYIIGFPSKTYYEFDLSGNFIPKNTYSSIEQLSQQVITFASKTGARIAVSDTELESGKVTADTYIFTPNYLGKSVATGAFVMNSDGSAYQETTTEKAAVPFRPYFTKTAGSRSTAHVESIIFGSTTDIENNSPSEGSHVDEDLIISSQRGKIIVESRLKGSTDVRIYTLSGVKVNTFTIRPGETIETPIHTSGVYIVRSVEGSLQMMTGKKLRVKGSH